ncbi:hypothetical protein F4777DRAFT_599955 [Nemania sp. FL0916]|nr:hypothetical protein F4777DRAFT_599955 [Nemania sp. FL0916]
MIDGRDRWKERHLNHPSRSKQIPWYHRDFEHKLQPSFRTLLQEWSGIAPEDREEAWQVFPWPCIGMFWFVEQGLLRHPGYPQILQRIISTSPTTKFLDLGTCLGQDIRTLLHGGAPAACLYGADVFPRFRDTGYTLFKDSNRLSPSHFIVGDIFSDVDDLAKSRGTWDIVHIAMFLQIFSLSGQEAASRNILKLLKPGSNSTIIDFQLQPPFCDPEEERIIYRYSKETIKTLKTPGIAGNTRKRGVAIASCRQVWFE